jgi:hypothetical protein
MILGIFWKLSDSKPSFLWRKIKISRNPTGHYSNVSCPQRSRPALTEIARQIQPDSITIRFDEPKLKSSTASPPVQERNTADIAQHSPAPENPPDSVPKPNPDNQVLGQFGTQELNILVFAAFTFMMGLDMGAGKVISSGTYIFDKNIGFSILYAIGGVPAR